MRPAPALLLPLLLTSVVLSGCIGGNDTNGDPFQGTCPSWTLFTSTDEDGNSVTPAAQTVRSFLMWNNTRGPGSGSWPDEHKESNPITPGSPGGVMLRGEYPVDFYEFSFDVAYTLDVDTRLSVQTESGRPLQFRDMSTDAYALYLDFPDGTNRTSDGNALPTYRVELSKPDSEPAPESIVLVWDHVPNKDGTADTNSFSFAVFDVHAWFRTC